MSQIGFAEFNKSIPDDGIRTGTDSYSTHTIKPPDRNITHSNITRQLFVDSSSRNRNIYPQPNNYQYRLDEMFDSAVSLELTLGRIPNSFYNIDTHNNKILLQETESNVVEITIDAGDYTIDELITEIESKLTSLLSSGDLKNTYDITYDSSTKKITWSITYDSSYSTPVFGLRFLQNSCDYKEDDIGKQYCPGSMGNVLGFAPNNFFTLKSGSVSGSSGDATLFGTGTKFNDDFEIGDEIVLEDDVTTTYEIEEIVSNTELTLTSNLSSDVVGLMIATNTLTADYQYNINPDQYFCVGIGPFSTNRLESNITVVNNAMGVIPINHDKEYTDFSLITMPTQRIIKYINPSDDITKIKIIIYRKDGTIYNFNGIDHFLEFNVTLLNQSGKYNTFSQSSLLS